MRLRSLLFVPGDSARKFEKARACGADGLIFDLEDSVAPGRKAEARETVASWLDARTPETAFGHWVRVNPFATGLALGDLAAVVRPGLDGIVLPKAGMAEVIRLGHCLDALEARAGMAEGSIRILVVATETPAAVLNLATYGAGHPRLAALTWGAEDLSAELGSLDNKDETGAWLPVFGHARSACLLAAAAAGVPALDTLHADFRDAEGLARTCRAARREGFTGRIAIHPDQVAVINEAFSPTEAEIAEAERVVAAFTAHPDAGTVGIDGKMVDIPHLRRAERVLAGVRT
jgi:citrate lyase subunit beta/citryl-CoA lyase